MINSFGYLLYFHLLCQFRSQQFWVIWNDSPKPQMSPALSCQTLAPRGSCFHLPLRGAPWHLPMPHWQVCHLQAPQEGSRAGGAQKEGQRGSSEAAEWKTPFSYPRAPCGEQGTEASNRGMGKPGWGHRLQGECGGLF